MFEKTKIEKWGKYFSAGVLALLLQACGGGGSDSGCTNLDPTRNSSLPSCSSTTTPVPAAVTTLTLALTDAAGASTTTVAPGNQGTVTALLKDASGAALPNIALSFTTTDKSGAFVPASGTALTDASGKAQVGLPAGTQSGAYVVTGNASVGGKVYSATLGYAVSFPTLTLSSLSIAPASLSAGGTASLSVTVLNGATPFAPAQSVSFTSACVSAGKASISSPVITVNGVASTSYTDMGCGGADTITASTVLNGTTYSKTGVVNVQPASAGQIVFVSAQPLNIALKGSGGVGRQETSLVTFKVLNSSGGPISGQLVTFALNTTAGGLTINPASATSGADGKVSTTVASGTVNTPVRVTATLSGTAISSLSDQLVVSTGIPEQNSFSLSTSIFNVEGMNYDGCNAPVGSSVTVRLSDHFHNPVPDGTAVSFTAEGASIDASCLTIGGACTVRFCAASPRPTDGRITVLAYALGEESFIDTNGNNLFESGESFTDLGEPFRDDRAISNANANGVDDGWSSGNATRTAGEAYIDSNGNSSWTATGDGQYNGVLQSPPNVNTSLANTIHVRGALVQVLSGSTANITALSATPFTLSQCTDGTAFTNTIRTLSIAIRDDNSTVFAMNRAGVAPLFLGSNLPGNILPAGTKIEFSLSNGTLLGDSSFIVPNTNAPDASAWIYNVQMQSDATQGVAPAYVCTNTNHSGVLTVKVTTPGGTITGASFTIND